THERALLLRRCTRQAVRAVRADATRIRAARRDVADTSTLGAGYVPEERWLYQFGASRTLRGRQRATGRGAEVRDPSWLRDCQFSLRGSLRAGAGSLRPAHVRGCGVRGASGEIASHLSIRRWLGRPRQHPDKLGGTQDPGTLDERSVGLRRHA